MATADWKVLPHGPLTRLADHLWIVDGEPGGGPPIGRRMAVFRLEDGRLVLHSPVALDEAAMAELDRLGPVGFIVVPNGFHRIDAPRFHARYPGAEVLCPPGSRTRVARRVTVMGDLGRLPASSRLRWEHLAGCGDREAAFVFTEEDGGSDLVVTDALFNLPDRLPGVGGLVVRLLGSTGGPKVTPLARLGMVRNRKSLADHLRRLAALASLRRVIMAHGAVIDHDPSGVLRGVADRLAR